MIHKNSGFIFLEVIVAIALVGITFLSLLQVGVQILTIASSIRSTNQADGLIKESMEAVRVYRDGKDWQTGLASLNTGSSNPYHLEIDDADANNLIWKWVAGEETIGKFIRKIIIDKVSRDPVTFAIESSYNSSHDNADTRKITAIVQVGAKTHQAVTYVTNWKK